MHFVKYVSAAAPGSRWDIACEYNFEEEDEDSEEVDNDTNEQTTNSSTNKKRKRD